MIAAVANLSSQERANFPTLAPVGFAGAERHNACPHWGHRAELYAGHKHCGQDSWRLVLMAGRTARSIQERPSARWSQHGISYRSTVLTALQEVRDALVLSRQGHRDRLVYLKDRRRGRTLCPTARQPALQQRPGGFSDCAGYPAHFAVIPRQCGHGTSLDQHGLRAPVQSIGGRLATPECRGPGHRYRCSTALKIQRKTNNA